MVIRRCYLFYILLREPPQINLCLHLVNLYLLFRKQQRRFHTNQTVDNAVLRCRVLFKFVDAGCADHVIAVHDDWEVNYIVAY